MRTAGYVIGAMAILWWLGLLAAYFSWVVTFPELNRIARTVFTVTPSVGVLLSIGLIAWGRAARRGVLFVLACILMLAAMVASALFVVLPGLLGLSVFLMRDM